jgi:hypothetical protein
MPDDNRLLEEINKKMNPPTPTAIVLWKSNNYVCSAIAAGGGGVNPSEEELKDKEPDGRPPSEIRRIVKEVSK